jgi:hypothetical protein
MQKFHLPRKPKFTSKSSCRHSWNPKVPCVRGQKAKVIRVEPNEIDQHTRGFVAQSNSYELRENGTEQSE